MCLSVKWIWFKDVDISPQPLNCSEGLCFKVLSCNLLQKEMFCRRKCFAFTFVDLSVRIPRSLIVYREGYYRPYFYVKSLFILTLLNCIIFAVFSCYIVHIHA